MQRLERGGGVARLDRVRELVRRDPAGFPEVRPNVVDAESGAGRERGREDVDQCGHPTGVVAQM